MTTSLFVVRGPVGVGKSSVSEALRQKMPNDSSIVETDAIKRMLDPNGSSDWRRTIAHDTAAFIVRSLLDISRTAIVEVHSKFQDFELQRYASIASEQKVPMINVLLHAPLDVCIERASNRSVPGISYAIDAAMVSDYYRNLDPRDGDLVFNTSTNSPEYIADHVIDYS